MAAVLQLHQALVDAGMPGSAATAPRAFVQGLAQRLGVAKQQQTRSSTSTSSPRQTFFDLLSHLLAKAPALASSWLPDYLAATSTLTSSDPAEADILQPATVLAWCQQTTAALQQRVAAFLQRGPSSGVDAVLELQQAAQALLSVAGAVRAVSSTSNSDDICRLVGTLQQLQQATKVLQVLEQLQQQQLASSPGDNSTAAATPSAGSSFGQQPLLRANNAAVAAWQQQVAQRRGAAGGSRLFLDDLLQQLQQAASLQDGSAALAFPYPDVLTAIDALFASSSSDSSSSDGDSDGSSSQGAAWHAKLAVLLYYLLDGGWLASAEPFAQGFQLPLTMVQEWQSHYLLDAAAAGASASSSSKAGAHTAALDKACQLLGAIACPTTPFRFVEALLQAGRPATALAVQRARCAGGGSSGSSTGSLGEAEVLLRVQLGCGLLSEAFCDLRRHCSQVPLADRSLHTNKLMRQLADWALSSSAAAASDGADAAASSMQQQLQLQDGDAHSLSAAAAAALGGSNGRQQQLLQLPLDAGEEAVLMCMLRERMAAGEAGGHLAPLYLLQRGRTLEALAAYADYRASPAAAGSDSGPASEAEAAASRSMLHKRLDAVMAAAAAALPPALRAAVTATTAAAAGSGDGTRSVLQGLGGSEVRRLQGVGGGGAGSLLVLRQRGVEAPVFLAPLLQAAAGSSSAGGGGMTAAAAMGAPAQSAAAAASGRRGGMLFAARAAQPGAAAAAAAAAARGGVFGQSQQQGAVGGDASRSLLFEREVLAEGGPGTVRVGGARDAAAAADGGAADVVPLLFGTPGPSAAAAQAGAGGVSGVAAASTAGRTPGIVRGGLFDTPAGLPPGAGGVFWGGGATPAAAGAAAGFGGMSEADFERRVRFAAAATPGKAAGADAAGPGAGVGGVFSYTGQRSHKRMRKTPI